ncbi:MAG: argininosuccinate synthase [Phycisphaerales bacterium JB039]
MPHSLTKVVLAYSGGLDTSAIVPWLIETYGCEVHAWVGDVGQGESELAGVEEKALASGAASCVVEDLRRQFIEEYVFGTLITGAVYEGAYLLGTSMARPILGRGQALHALKIGADGLAHGCTGKGNDQVRFEAAYAATAPDLPVIAPWRQWDLRSREDVLEYIESRGVPCSASRQKLYSRDRNLWHISHEGGLIEDPWNEPPEDAWMLTRPISDTPDEPRDVEIEFKRGRPVALDGLTLPGHELVAALNDIAGMHGVGRVDIVENRVVGMKSRGLYETPGGTVIVAALRALEQLVLDHETLALRESLGLKFADLVYGGKWFVPVRAAISAACEHIAQRLEGTIVVRLHKGHATAIKRASPNSIYSEEHATFGADNVYHQGDAAGFIRLYTLPERIAGLRARDPHALSGSHA